MTWSGRGYLPEVRRGNWSNRVIKIGNQNSPDQSSSELMEGEDFMDTADAGACREKKKKGATQAQPDTPSRL